MRGIWIRCGRDIGSVSPAFAKQFTPKKPIQRATARASAMGLYKLMINGRKVGNALLTPGATSYAHRVLYQEYDATDLLKDGENRIEIIGGKGWAISRFGNDGTANNFADHVSVIGEIEIEYKDGEIEILPTDEGWECFSTKILDSEIYDGETVNPRRQRNGWRGKIHLSFNAIIKEHGARTSPSTVFFCLFANFSCQLRDNTATEGYQVSSDARD